jgi:hypothetical protein
MQLEGTDLITTTDINNQVSGNYNPDARLKTEPWPLPLTFRVGIAMNIVGGNDPVISSEKNRVTIAIDGVHPNDNTEKLNFGGEYAWNENIFARLGYKMNYDVEKWTYGVGLKFDIGTTQVGFDFAQVDFSDLGNVSQISFEMRL